MAGFPPGKRFVKKGLDALGLELRRVRPVSGSGSASFSNFNEDPIIRGLLAKIQPRHRFAVDIGAGDGETMSNSYSLFKSGWEGIAAEWDAARFAKLAYRYSAFPGARLIRTRITPDNVLNLLASCEAPKELGFLNLDIDSYDHYVLEKLLTAYRPSLICAEINEKIPPPVRFTVKWNPDHAWTQDHFFGQSLSILEDLGKRQGYALVGLEYNNAFLIPRELNPVPVMAAAEAYRQGYADRPDRLQRLPWNKDMEPLLKMPSADAIAFIREKFKPYEGRYVLE
ncbi:MAG TPA: hypothetical protein VJ385_11325 [Fibrobacteria bacterium]|nr:hypothetical protein [Fibrobacteria bacterium]